MATLFAFSLVACGGPSESGVEQDEIIGGSGAQGARFDAIGTIGNLEPDGKYFYFCSATLVSPTMIVTARHCAISNLPVSGPQPTTVRVAPTYFAVGPNAKRPRRLVQIAAAAYAEPAPEGWLGGPTEFGLGHDVAVMTLSEPILDIRPIPVGTRPLSPGMSVTNVGFGISSFEPLRDGTRKQLQLQIDALSGAPGQIAFGNLAAFLAAGDQLGHDEVLIQQTPDHIRRDFERQLSTFEVYAGKAAATQGGNSCFGDSGGPLLDLSQPTAPVLVGVTSGGFACDFGGTYARVDRPATQRLLSSDPCAHIPASGDCSGDFLVTCQARGMIRTPKLVDCAASKRSCSIDTMGVAACGANAWEPTFPTCNVRKPIDRPVTATTAVGLPPAPRGGNMRDGTWVLASHVFYDKEGDDIGPGGFIPEMLADLPPERNTIYVSHARIQMAESEDTFLTPLSWYLGNQTYRPEIVAARGYVLRMDCPVHESFEYGVTATANAIDIYEYWGGNIVSIAHYTPALASEPLYAPEPPLASLSVPMGLARRLDPGLLLRDPNKGEIRRGLLKALRESKQQN